MAAPFFFISHHFSMFSPVDKYTGHKKNARWNLDQLDSYPTRRRGQKEHESLRRCEVYERGREET